MFATENTTKFVTAPAAIPIVEINDIELSPQEQATPELDNSQTTATDAATLAAASLENQKALKTPTVVRKTPCAMPARTTKKANKTKGRQQYVRSQFSDMAVSVAVALVLQHKPEQVLEIAAVVDAIFQSQMPPAVRSLVRNQVTNILSEGARKNKWYRPQPGSYSWSSQ